MSCEETNNCPVDHAVEVAMARADGYKEALDDCDRADVAKLIAQVAVLEGRLSLQKALTTIAERKFEGQAARIAELEDAARTSPSTGELFNELLRRIDFDGMDPRTFGLAELGRAIPGAQWPASAPRTEGAQARAEAPTVTRHGRDATTDSAE